MVLCFNKDSKNLCYLSVENGTYVIYNYPSKKTKFKCSLSYYDENITRIIDNNETLERAMERLNKYEYESDKSAQESLSLLYDLKDIFTAQYE